ncbi:hypothetical protein [Alteromonas sp. CNT1-28]|jgi:hypothetical protein|uniref:hypothetical protein n=1 Tax=Alteromonas sp. CNT1-28 TaxID=2917730 RepID=UPI001EF1F857|nr:hypothetical protein [Alteromonas sp. CNT1-28]MCG7639704.1 hypothetical protein [Alteromonas sp. CNT1-28]
MNRFIQGSIEPTEITELLQRVNDWFDSEQATRIWFNTERLAAFDNLTPRQVVERYQAKGIHELNNWITEREFGGFQ